MEPVILRGQGFTLEELYDIAYKNRPVEIAPEAYARLEEGRNIMLGLAKGGKAIYGLNRGVGWNKDRDIDEEAMDWENQKVLRSHALGMPPYNRDVEVRAMMAIRLNNLLIGASCSSDALADRYRDFLNHGITPLVPKRGSVGEADITTITHIGMAFIGDGKVSYKGEIMEAKDAIAAEGLPAYRMTMKDAHTIMLGNCQGEAMAAVLVKEVEELVEMSDLIYCLDYEGLNGNIESMRADTNALRGLPGQMERAARCRQFLEGSYLYEDHPDRALQDALTFRGGFTITGSVTDAINFVKQFLNIQINSPSDNPCIMPETGEVLVNSNFETTSLVLAVEMLNIALGHLSRAVAYRMIKMSSPDFTGLTRFLAPRDGSSHGYSTIQNSYMVMDAENRRLVNPSSMDFFPIEGNIEDHASNLPLACSKGLKMVDNIRYLVGMEALYAAQAVDLRGDIRLGRATAAAYRTIREIIPTLGAERIVYDDIREAYELVLSGKLLEQLDG